jgi:RNHCP domain
MRPERIDRRPGKGLVVIHRCTRCGAERANRIACDTVQPDDVDEVTAVMAGSAGQLHAHHRSPPGLRTDEGDLGTLRLARGVM